MYSDRIAALRREHGWSRQELADRIGVSQTAVYKWETGATQPNIETLQKLSALFGVSLDDLCGAMVEPADPGRMAVMARAFSRLTEEEQEKYLAVGRALFAHAFAEKKP